MNYSLLSAFLKTVMIFIYVFRQVLVVSSVSGTFSLVPLWTTEKSVSSIDILKQYISVLS